MNPELKKVWVEALRSGKYRQAQKVLGKDDRYCCLGVLCQVAGMGHMKADPEHGRYATDIFYLQGTAPDFDGVSTSLPRRWRDEVAQITDRQENDLIEMNDRQGKGFQEIADWVEENL